MSVDNSTYTQPDVDADFTGSGNSYLNCGRMHVKSEAQTEIESKYIFVCDNPIKMLTYHKFSRDVYVLKRKKSMKWVVAESLQYFQI